MAKRAKANAAHRGLTVVKPEAATTGKVSSRTQKLIDAIRKPFVAYVQGFAALTTKREALAYPFMTAFAAWAEEMGNGRAGSFIAWVRLLDPSLPVQPSEYRGHSALNAARYLQTLYNAQERERLTGNRTETGGGTTAAGRARKLNPVQGDEADVTANRISPLLTLSRALATILPMMADPTILWKAVETEYALKPEQITRLHRVVERVKPLLTLTGRGGAAVKGMAARIVHAEAAEVAEPEMEGRERKRA